MSDGIPRSSYCYAHPQTPIPRWQLFSTLRAADRRPFLPIFAGCKLEDMSAFGCKLQMNLLRFRGIGTCNLLMHAFLRPPKHQFSIAQGQPYRICRIANHRQANVDA